MKKKLLKLVNYTLILFLLALSGCEKDLYENGIKEPAKANGQINYVTIDDVPLIKPNVEKFKKNISSKTAKGKISDLDLDLEHIIQYTESNGFTSYSIPIKIDTLETKDYYFQNLNIITDGKEYGSFVVKYNPANDLKTFDLSTFTGTTEYYDENLNLRQSVGFVNGVPNESYTVNTGKGNNLTGKNETPAPSPGGDDDGGGGGGIDDGGSCPCNSTSLIQQFFEWVGKVLASINISLPEGSGDNKAYVLAVTPPNTGTPTDAGSTVETFSGGGSITFVPNEPQWTYPLSSQNLMATRIMQRIEATDPSVFTWLADVNNLEKVKELYFILHEENSITTRQLALTRINAAIIEKKIDDTKLDPCTKAVLDKLKNLKQDDIAGIMSKLGGKSEVYTLTFDIGNTNGNLAATSRNSLNSYVTILDRDFLDGNDGTGINKPPTDLAIAAVIIHEVVHAYFFSLFDDKLNNNIPALNDFDLLYQRYVTNKYVGSDDAQHAQIWQNFIGIMSSALQEYHTGVPTSNPSPFYQDIMMGTLMGTNTFKNKYPQGSEEYNIIKNNYITEKNNGSNDPNYTPKGKPCK